MKLASMSLIAFLGSMVVADDVFLSAAKSMYDYGNWPSGAERNVYVSTNWIPNIDIDVPDNGHIVTNTGVNSVRLMVFHGNIQAMEVRATQFSSSDEAKNRMIHFLADSSSGEPFARGTNDWNAIGDLCYLRNLTTNSPICVFYYGNVLGTVLSDDQRYPAPAIARKLYAEIQSRPTPDSNP